MKVESYDRNQEIRFRKRNKDKNNDEYEGKLLI